MPDPQPPGKYIQLISVHGLIRANDLELGRDADTGGQTKYVVELARALAARDDVDRVDLLTRRVVDPHVDPGYAEPFEKISDKAWIVRLEAGPEEYLPKEQLWDHLPSFIDNAITYINEEAGIPAIVHTHYADAGFVGQHLSKLFGIPLVHTGHSLGRVKRMRLLAGGSSPADVENLYNMSRRVLAEEETLAAAQMVVTSTANEIEKQYGLYDYYQPDKMVVIPPGTDIERFHTPDGSEIGSDIAGAVDRFLRQPEKPMILALSRPDPRKNIVSLVKAYGESAELQELANLVIVAGNREDISRMEPTVQDVLTELLLTIDRYDLYGKVAYPKAHQSDDVPTIYRLAAARQGVFVNPALTEPFGLTLIEAAASGLPIVATEDGGPRDIVGNCHNGLLVDPLDTQAMADSLRQVLSDRQKWESYSKQGLDGVRKHYSWSAHAETYMGKVNGLTVEGPPAPRIYVRRRSTFRDRALFTDLDQSLLGDARALQAFNEQIRENRKCVCFGIATGRQLDSTIRAIRRHGIAMPDVLITATGTAVYYNPDFTGDSVWENHIDNDWTPRAVHRLLDDLPGLKLQPPETNSKYKIGYYIDLDNAPCMDEIQSLVYQAELNVNLILSFGQYLDVIPHRASKGLALRYVAMQLGIPLEQVLVAGGSGADEDMMWGNTLSVVVANRHGEELSRLEEGDRIYYATREHAAGIMEAIDHYDFFDECRVPDGDTHS